MEAFATLVDLKLYLQKGVRGNDEDLVNTYFLAAHNNNIPVLLELFQNDIYPKSKQKEIIQMLICNCYNEDIILTLLKKSALTTEDYYDILEVICCRKFTKMYSLVKDNVFDYVFDRLYNYNWSVAKQEGSREFALKPDLPQLVLYDDSKSYFLKRFLDSDKWTIKGLDIDLLIENKCVNNIALFAQKDVSILKDERIKALIIEVTAGDLNVSTPEVMNRITELKPKEISTKTYEYAIMRGSLELMKLLPKVKETDKEALKKVCVKYKREDILNYL